MPYIPGRPKKRDSQNSAPQKDAHSGDLDILRLKNAYAELESVHRQMKESHIEMILRLAIAAEYKDPDTGNHILRISDYATEVAQALKLSLEDQEKLRYASPMHDIGKIGIPDRILQKPGKLTEEEFEIMKDHTNIGARIFQNSRSPILQAASEIALTHHEKFDGTGYPRKLKGKDIPIFGRIVAMVDVFDALVSKRCYKDKWSFEKACEYIQTLAGNHLDPDIVKIFLKIEPNVRRIYEANTTIEKYVQEVGDEQQERLL